MTRRLRGPIAVRLEGEAERARQNHEDRITELQKLPATGLEVKPDISLANGVVTQVAHGLGRRPQLVLLSPPRGASSSGRIEEVRSDGLDRTKLIALKATGWGATITVDVGVL